jgi:hypothetical protein
MAGWMEGLRWQEALMGGVAGGKKPGAVAVDGWREE